MSNIIVNQLLLILDTVNILSGNTDVLQFLTSYIFFLKQVNF